MSRTVGVVVAALVLGLVGCATAEAPAAPQDAGASRDVNDGQDGGGRDDADPGDVGGDVAGNNGGGEDVGTPGDADEDGGAGDVAEDSGPAEVGDEVGDDVGDDAGDDVADDVADDADTTVEPCGNDQLDEGEDCDDGNRQDGDRCPSDCRWPADLCAPCGAHSECGGAADLCVVLTDGSFCGRACADATWCPDGFDCVNTDADTRQCLPEGGLCSGCLDPDGDGYGLGTMCLGLDCDEVSGANHADAEEVCDGVDNDCDGEVDEGVSNACGGCGEVPEEVCDGVDNDCDGEVDEGVPTVTGWPDGDGDGHGARGSASVEVCALGGAVAGDALDCDDGNGAIFPGAEEVCDGVDNDCDDVADNGLSPVMVWPDVDGDGFGDGAAAPITACGVAAGQASNGDDCNDGDGGVRPTAGEVCDGIDNNCTGVVDEGGICPCASEYREGHTYLFCASPASWTTAQSTCAGLGYTLVRVDDDAENSWLRTTGVSRLALCTNTCRYAGDIDCDDGGPGYDYNLCELGSDCQDCGPRVPTRMWLGINDRVTEGSYAWDGGGGGYTHWASGEPNNSGGEDCGELLLDQAAGGWNDKECGDARPWVCESR